MKITFQCYISWFLLYFQPQRIQKLPSQPEQIKTERHVKDESKKKVNVHHFNNCLANCGVSEKIRQLPGMSRIIEEAIQNIDHSFFDPSLISKKAEKTFLKVKDHIKLIKEERKKKKEEQKKKNKEREEQERREKEQREKERRQAELEAELEEESDFDMNESEVDTEMTRIPETDTFLSDFMTDDD